MESGTRVQLTIRSSAHRNAWHSAARTGWTDGLLDLFDESSGERSRRRAIAADIPRSNRPGGYQREAARLENETRSDQMVRDGQESRDLQLSRGGAQTFAVVDATEYVSTAGRCRGRSAPRTMVRR